MGGFDTYLDQHSERPVAKSVLTGSVGNSAENTPRDLRIIEQTLVGAGLLTPQSTPERTRHAIFSAIRHIEHSIARGKRRSPSAAPSFKPGSDAERVFRHAIAKGRFPLTHRAVQETTAKRGAKVLLGGAMRRARERLDAETIGPTKPSPRLDKNRRALLPSISAETFQANRRLVETLVVEDRHPLLAHLISETATHGGKQGFADLRDLWRALSQRDMSAAEAWGDAIEELLSGKSRQRFKKLRTGEPPSELDFAEY